MTRARKLMAISFLLLPSICHAQQKQNGFLHPKKKPLTEQMVKDAQAAAIGLGADLVDFSATAKDGAVLEGWKIHAKNPKGDWVVLLHGVSDNRTGVLAHGEVLLRHGYSVLLMDARAHGESGGDMATYGWLERHDLNAIADSLYKSEKVHCFFALGESMGASILLQAGEVEPRISGVVAGAAFCNLREAGYNYVSLGLGSWLGRSLLRPIVSGWINSAEKEGGFKVDDVSPEKAVAARPFAILLIAGKKDKNLPPRYSERIWKAAIGSKDLWLVPSAGHTQALGREPAEFEKRVTAFFSAVHESAGAK